MKIKTIQVVKHLLFLFLFPLVAFSQQLPQRVDLTPYCPIPGNQGNLQSCTGWAIGYGAMTIEKAKQVNQKNRQIITQNAYSAAFLYQQLNQGNCHKGVTITAALALAKQKGNCLAGQFDRRMNNCKQIPGRGLQQKALANKIKGYQAICTKKTTALNKIQVIRQALAKGKPVIASMQLKENFLQVRKGAKFYWPNQGKQTATGGHAIVVVGYDDQKRAFRLMNSMGTNWGDGGFIWVKYEAFQAMCRGAYVVYI